MHNWSTSLVALTVGSLLTFACTSQSDLQEGGGVGGVTASGGMAVGGTAGSAVSGGRGGSSANGVGGMLGTGGLGDDCICDYMPPQDGSAGGADGASSTTVPDAASKDSSVADGPVICGCPLVPASCPYGYQTGPAPCGCLSCAPAASNLDASSCTWPANFTPSSDASGVGLGLRGYRWSRRRCGHVFVGGVQPGLRRRHVIFHDEHPSARFLARLQDTSPSDSLKSAVLLLSL
jgi:hypothetical protein